MRSKKEILDDCINVTYLGKKVEGWHDTVIDRLLMLELLADVRDELKKI